MTTSHPGSPRSWRTSTLRRCAPQLREMGWLSLAGTSTNMAQSSCIPRCAPGRSGSIATLLAPYLLQANLT